MATAALPRLNVTGLSQYIRLENRERFLRFRLHPDEAKALLRKWSLTIQPLTPLLQESGAQFEQDVEKRIASRDEQIVRLEKEDLPGTLHWLRKARKPVEASIGGYLCHGRADAVRLRRDTRDALHIFVADIKASRHERIEHRLQIAIYARLLREKAEREGIRVGSVKGAVFCLHEVGSLPEADCGEEEGRTQAQPRVMRQVPPASGRCLATASKGLTGRQDATRSPGG